MRKYHCIGTYTHLYFENNEWRRSEWDYDFDIVVIRENISDAAMQMHNLHSKLMVLKNRTTDNFYIMQSQIISMKIEDKGEY